MKLDAAKMLVWGESARNWGLLVPEKGGFGENNTDLEGAMMLGSYESNVMECSRRVAKTQRQKRRSLKVAKAPSPKGAELQHVATRFANVVGNRGYRARAFSGGPGYHIV